MSYMYNVRMKRVTATQARRNWFRLLDEVAAGEVVVIERKGRRIVLRREEEAPEGEAREPPDYSTVLRAPGAEEADRWSWAWTGDDVKLVAEEPAAHGDAVTEGEASGGRLDDPNDEGDGPVDERA